jgi:hypothetical protein
MLVLLTAQVCALELYHQASPADIVAVPASQGIL